MIIHIEICDVCQLINRGGIPVTRFSTETTIPETWDVCPGCAKGPFKVVRGTRPLLNHLLARIEALILTELKLTKDPV